MKEYRYKQLKYNKSWSIRILFINIISNIVLNIRQVCQIILHLELIYAKRLLDNCLSLFLLNKVKICQIFNCKIIFRLLGQSKLDLMPISTATSVYPDNLNKMLYFYFHDFLASLHSYSKTLKINKSLNLYPLYDI